MAIRLLSFRKRAFLNSAATLSTSYIQAVIDSSRNGEHPWGTNMLTIADCRRKIELEFFLGDKTDRRRSLAKINLLIDFLTSFRDALAEEIKLIENYDESE
jgi:hypothetical protein